MDLAVAVRAEHHTLEKLGRDLLPLTCKSVPRYSEGLLTRIEVVELEERIGDYFVAALAGRPHEFDCPPLLDSSLRRSDVPVSTAMAVRAEEHALVGLS